MRSPDHPELTFVQARHFTRGRGGRKTLWIVIHDMEAGESGTRAESTAEYFRTMPDGRTVSSHYVVDDDSVIQCVRLADTAYTVGNTPGNAQGINWEFSGFAGQTRAQWLDAFGLAMFAKAAPYIRSDAARFSIPLRRCSVADLKAFRRGITSHNDLRLAFGGTTHTDPGPNFPWDVFMQIITGEDDDDMTPAEFVKILQDPTVAKLMRALPWQYVGGGIPVGYSALKVFAETHAYAKAATTRVELTATRVELTARLDAVLAAALDDGDMTVVLPPEAITQLTELRDAVAGLPDVAELRDAVADLGEGGAVVVRADTE